MNTFVRHLLRIALAVLLLGLLLVQVLVPVFAAQVGTRFPEVRYLVIPYSVAAIVFVGCWQLSLLAIWRLVSLVDEGSIFTSRAPRWVRVIIGCAVFAVMLCAGVLIHMLAAVPGGGGPVIYYLGAAIVAGLTFALLIVVMRGLLASAIANRAELDEVI